MYRDGSSLKAIDLIVRIRKYSNIVEDLSGVFLFILIFYIYGVIEICEPGWLEKIGLLQAGILPLFTILMLVGIFYFFRLIYDLFYKFSKDIKKLILIVLLIIGFLVVLKIIFIFFPSLNNYLLRTYSQTIVFLLRILANLLYPYWCAN